MNRKYAFFNMCRSTIFFRIICRLKFWPDCVCINSISRKDFQIFFCDEKFKGDSLAFILMINIKLTACTAVNYLQQEHNPESPKQWLPIESAIHSHDVDWINIKCM